AALNRNDRASEPKPVASRKLPVSDGHEARQTRLRGEQVIAARVETAFGHTVADGEQLAVAVEQKVEAHRSCQRPRGVRDCAEAPFDVLREAIRPHGDIALVALD